MYKVHLFQYKFQSNYILLKGLYLITNLISALANLVMNDFPNFFRYLFYE
jgi:hypothetical protein